MECLANNPQPPQMNGSWAHRLKPSFCVFVMDMTSVARLARGQPRALENIVRRMAKTHARQIDQVKAAFRNNSASLRPRP